MVGPQTAVRSLLHEPDRLDEAGEACRGADSRGDVHLVRLGMGSRGGGEVKVGVRVRVGVRVGVWAWVWGGC